MWSSKVVKIRVCVCFIIDEGLQKTAAQLHTLRYPGDRGPGGLWVMTREEVFTVVGMWTMWETHTHTNSRFNVLCFCSTHTPPIVALL